MCCVWGVLCVVCWVCCVCCVCVFYSIDFPSCMHHSSKRGMKGRRLRVEGLSPEGEQCELHVGRYGLKKGGWGEGE